MQYVPVAARVFEREVEPFRQRGGGLRMAEALRLGINRKTLYAMRDAGVVVPVSRGVYRLASLDPLAHPDLVTVAKRVPQGVLCLVSGENGARPEVARVPSAPAEVLPRR